jgi:monoamine oxidase
MFSKTKYWDDRQVSEWSGELIDSGHKTIRQLARRFNLPLDDLLASEPENAEETYRFFDAYYTIADAKADFARVFNSLKKRSPRSGLSHPL